jgi:hypothetical protein
VSPLRACRRYLAMRASMPVRQDQHSRRSADCTDHRKLPFAVVRGVHQLHAFRPRPRVDAARRSEVEQYSPGHSTLSDSGPRTDCPGHPRPR